MATIKEEFETLKLRVAKGESQQTITMIDHGSHIKTTCSVIEGFNLLKIRIGKGESDVKIHIVDHLKEKERKLTNPKKSTKKIFNCRTPEQWKEFNAALEPYFEIARDPHIAVDLIIRALKLASADEIRSWLTEGHQEESDQPGQAPPHAEIPEWLR